MQKKCFNLENSLYKKELIEQAIEDFGDEFKITFSESALEISAEKEDEIHEIFHEFMNYVIGLHNEA